MIAGQPGDGSIRHIAGQNERELKRRMFVSAGSGTIDTGRFDSLNCCLHNRAISFQLMTSSCKLIGSGRRYSTNFHFSNMPSRFRLINFNIYFLRKVEIPLRNCKVHNAGSHTSFQNGDSMHQNSGFLCLLLLRAMPPKFTIIC